MISSNECILSYFKKTFTPMGKRDMLERILNPISDVEELNKRIHRIEIVSTIKTKKGVEHCLKQISDLPRIHHKFTNYTINAQDILSQNQYLQGLITNEAEKLLFNNFATQTIKHLTNQ